MTDPIDIAEGYSAEPYGDGYLICHSGGGRAVAQLDMAAAVREIARLRAALAAQVPQPVAGASGLLPCPFCGRDDCDAVDLPPDNLRPTETHYIVCHECGLEGPLHDSRAEAAAAWNRRAAPSASPPTTLAVPAGMALVPVQPTFDMLSALFGYWLNVSHPQHRSVAQSTYAAMLAAAPQSPQPAQ